MHKQIKLGWVKCAFFDYLIYFICFFCLSLAISPLPSPSSSLTYTCFLFFLPSFPPEAAPFFSFLHPPVPTLIFPPPPPARQLFLSSCFLPLLIKYCLLVYCLHSPSSLLPFLTPSSPSFFPPPMPSFFPSTFLPFLPSTLPSFRVPHLLSSLFYVFPLPPLPFSLLLFHPPSFPSFLPASLPSSFLPFLPPSSPFFLLLPYLPPSSPSFLRPPLP